MTKTTTTFSIFFTFLLFRCPSTIIFFHRSVFQCSVDFFRMDQSVPYQFARIKKKTKFSSYNRKSREWLKSHRRLTASSKRTKYLRIYSYIRKPFLIYDFATAPIWISLNMRKIFFSFFQCAFFHMDQKSDIVCCTAGFNKEKFQT
jgi:hypothetical protein